VTAGTGVAIFTAPAITRVRMHAVNIKVQMHDVNHRVRML
jgi:hypothetical protein